MTFYPPKIQDRFSSPQNAGRLSDPNATGRAVSLQCGSFVSFSLKVGGATKMIEAVRFRTNGCGFLIAAADLLATEFSGRKLADLHGLKASETSEKIESEFGTFPIERVQCVEICIEALRAAFSDYRTTQVAEFRGETALICTCFGVSEDVIERHIDQSSLTRVEEVAQICNAGSGCGSCRMLIQEMIDARRDPLL